MKQQIELISTPGKTIERMVGGFHEDILFIFTDKTFVYLKADWDEYEPDNPVLNHPKFDLFEQGFTEGQLIVLGITTQEEIDEIKRERDAKREESERAQYERLHAKYGK